MDTLPKETQLKQVNIYNKVTEFTGGNTKLFAKNWEKLTSDTYILDIIKNGLRLDFKEFPQNRQYQFKTLKDEELNIVKEEVQKLLSKQVICESNREKNDYLSNVFTRDKRNGGKRMILNLKHFNTHIAYHHFKMESIHQVIDIIRKDVYMASIDLKDAFYSIPIHPKHQKYLKFFIENKIYQYTCMPNGYGPAMRIFTKVSKVPFSHLRSRGHISVVFVDDSYLQGNTYEACVYNIRNTIDLLQSLGFTIHSTKSILTPTQKITFLGFVIDSVNMTLEITEDKKNKIYELCNKLLTSNKITIRMLASVIGNFVASFPAVPLGPFFYRKLEQQKIDGLKFNKGNFDANIKLNEKSKEEICWWKNNIFQSYARIDIPNPDITIYTDASHIGWGITDGITPSGGRWDENEKAHINVLELKAIQIGILTYCKNRIFKHARIMSDNTTAITYINKKGGLKSSECNKIAKEIWLWCSSRELHVSAAHIPGKENLEADKNSRKFNDEIEWQLNPNLFKSICDMFGVPEIDLFASRINRQTIKYVSWKPEPEAFAIDAFTMNWADKFLYIFPPFSLLTKVIRKINHDKARGILVYPAWSTQPWYPQVLDLARKSPFKITPRLTNLILPQDKTAIHPLAEKLTLHVITFNLGD